VLLVAPPISAPSPKAFYKDLKEYVARNELGGLTTEEMVTHVENPKFTDVKPVCDVFVLTLMMISDLLPVVIPAGNNGAARLAHPADPKAYANVKKVLSDGLGRALAIRYIEDILFEPFDANLDRIAELTLEGYIANEPPLVGSAYAEYLTKARRFTPEQRTTLDNWLNQISSKFASDDDIIKNPNADHFKETGIIVVGAGSVMLKSEDRKNFVTEAGIAPSDTTPLTPTPYSQTGGGLCLIAPSNGRANYDPSCHPANELRARAIPAADIYGYAGFADDPRALFSHADQKERFGGTSAAAAQVAAILAYLPDNTSGPDARIALIEGAYRPNTDTPYNANSVGHGQERFKKEWKQP